MKKVVLILSAVVLSVTAFAQKGKVLAAETMLSSNDVDGAKKAIDEAIVNEKSVSWPKTYIVAAKVYTKLKETGKDADGVKKALDFYLKASELDKKGDAEGKGINKFEKDLTLEYMTFKNVLTNAGVEGFNTENFGDALSAFEGVLKVNELSGLTSKSVDTAIVYNCALAAYNAKNWTKAEEYFNKTIDLRYGNGDAVILLHQVFSTVGDSAKMGANLANGFEKYPNDNRILTTLINYYLGAHQNDQALSYLNKAIEKDPSNPSYFYARGVLFDQSKVFDKAEADYNKCLEMDPNFFNALYNMGVMFYNKGVEKNNDANNISEMKAFEAARKQANELFNRSLPYMEKAYSVLESKADSSNSEKIAVLESLKNLYYRFDNLEKYNSMKNKIEELQKQ
jgi:tetratricopeptide (TPR) repeat protein